MPKSAHPKAPRRSASHTRLHVNLGSEMGITREDIVETILGHTGVPRNVIGAIDLRDRYLFVDVESEHANSIIAKLKRTQIKGQKAKVKLA